MSQEPLRPVDRASLASCGFTRRDFLRCTSAAAAALAVGGVMSAGAPRLLGAPASAGAAGASGGGAISGGRPESIVKLLYESLSDKQKKQVCFDWDHVRGKQGLLRTRVQNNWKITNPDIKSGFYTADQQAMIRHIFEGMTDPSWHSRFDQQLKDDIGGWGKRQAIAMFGAPGSGKFEFVLTSRHMTLRCDGDSADHVAFGGPILYAHEGERLFEKPDHPSNVFWHQALEANKLFGTLDGRHQKQALVVEGMPSEELVGFKGKAGPFQGVPVTELSRDQKAELQRIVKLLLEPFRKSDRDEAVKCLNVQGGLDACYLAFYKQGDLGEDGVYDNWRLEGPSFVWYFRGKPHVHVWVNVADDPHVELNAWQDSILSPK